MEGLTIDEAQVEATFDNLVERQIILYGDGEVHVITDQGFKVRCLHTLFEFRICSSFLTKPCPPGVSASTCSDLPTFGPGSDLLNTDPGLTVTTISKTHLLLLNRFCALRPQYIILTLDSFRRQTEPLDEQDLAAAWITLQALASKEHFVIYNCGPEAGCSRLHKHLQVFPIPMDEQSGEMFTMFPDLDDDAMKDVPFRYFIDQLGNIATITDQVEDIQQRLWETYQRLLSEVKTCFFEAGGLTDKISYIPHNVVITKKWMLVIPRRMAKVGHASAGAAAMMGMVWMAERQQFDEWLELGPAKVLAMLGVRA